MRHRPALRRRADFPDGQGRCEWAVAWPLWSDGFTSYYCNTIPTPDGGTHEAGLRAALTKGVRAFGDLVGNKRAKDITADDVMQSCECYLSVFIRNPHFQSQTKDRLTSLEAARFVEAAMRDHVDHFLTDNMDRGRALLGSIVERMEERLKRRAEREVKRKTATSARKLRLPGKLTDCSATSPRAPNCSSSKATAPAARPSRPATARPRRSSRSAARSSTSPPPPPTRSAPIRKWAISSSPWAAASATGSTRRATLRKDHHHD